MQSLIYIMETVDGPYGYEQFAGYVTTHRLFTFTYTRTHWHYDGKSLDNSGNMSNIEC